MRPDDGDWRLIERPLRNPAFGLHRVGVVVMRCASGVISEPLTDDSVRQTKHIPE